MHLSQQIRACLCAIALAGASVLGITSSAVAAPAGTFTTVVSGLDNPRDLAFSPNGKLYVAEAGHGGLASDCVAGGPEGATCPGFTSGISVVDIPAAHAQRIVSGLASVSGEGGFAAVGLDGLSFLANGTLYGIMAESSDAVPDGVFRPEITAGLKAQLGRLIQSNTSGQWKVVADVGHRDFLWTTEHKSLVPDQFPDANPYGVLALPDNAWVVDAGSNTLDRVRPNGAVSVVAFFPNPPASDAVPTCLDRGPDGALYIGELTGGGNSPGSSVVWRFAPGATAPTVWATGLTAVTGCGFGGDGRFYAVEFSKLGLDNAAPMTGQVVRVEHGHAPVVVADGLSFPGGFAAGPDNKLYVSNWSIAPTVTGLGAVVRITP
jgi:hypothetical protein